MVAMRAIRFHTYGDPDVLRLEEIPRPEPRAGEMLVRVRAAGVNPVDYKTESGATRAFLGELALPHTAGLDFSGVIEALADPVPGFQVGDAVYGRVPRDRDGSYADYVVVRAQDIAHKPLSIDHVHAAALPTAVLAAWSALFRSATQVGIDLHAGQSVLIHGGAGGVGTFAVQLAHWAQARVAVTARREDAAFLRDLGAAIVVDYRSERFEDRVGAVDGVVDTIGGDIQRRSLAVLHRGGTLAGLLGIQVEQEAAARGIRTVAIVGATDARILAEVARLIDAGTLQVEVAQVLPLAQAREAQVRLQRGQVRGKIVLAVGPGD